MATARRRWPWITLSLASLALVLGLTLTPTRGTDTRTFLTCLMCGQFGLSDDLGNVALFMPLAVGLYLAGLPGRRTIALLFALSGTIELLQLGIPGRESSLADVLTNSLGAAAGVGLAWWLPRRPRTTLSGWLAAAGALGLYAAIGYAFQPSIPGGRYYVVWTPERSDSARFRGKVLGAEAGGVALDPGRVGNPGRVRDSLLAGGLLRARMIAERPMNGSFPRLEVYDIAHREIVELAEDKHPGIRGDLLLHVRLHAGDLRLRQPDLRWVGVLGAVGAGDTIVVGFRRAAHSWCLSFDGRERCDFTYPVGRAWGLLQFAPHTPAATEAALGALLMGIVGFCAGLFVRRSAAGYLAAGVALAGAVAVPPLMGLAFTPLVQLAGLAAGAAGGLFVP